MLKSINLHLHKCTGLLLFWEVYLGEGEWGGGLSTSAKNFKHACPKIAYVLPEIANVLPE